ncbi:MAG TPA: carboxypeptidase regulatory-like domain-containing protein [Pyrinomonadaceae bacterium]|nr:carboxypeptidase regulatory-like domain-containing protein [Pyrinomonadaceae bacterium]
MKPVYWLLLVLFASSSALAQTGSLRGLVTDQNGAAVAGAKVTVNGPSGLLKTTTSDKTGSYSFTGLPPSDYEVQASAPNLELAEPVKISLKGGVQTLDLQLKVVLAPEKVTVEENGTPSVSTDANSNASAQVLRGDDLDALPDSPEDLQAALLALAGPSAGPSGGQIFIDGFSGGQLPSKESIREIRINQNPFTPEYDKLGFGRIEIFTKPGTDKFKGSVYFNFADQFWNTRNPYARQKAPLLLKEYGGSMSGALNKRASFFLDVRRDEVDNGAIINAITLDPQTFAIINPFTDVFRTRQRRFGINPRIDYQLNAENTLTVRYGFTRADIRGAGIGGFNLVSRGTHPENKNHTLQVTETAVLGKNAINETRFQFFRTYGPTVANDLSPALQVLGSFNGGGAQVGHSFDARTSYELQNYTSIISGTHSWKFGIRLRRENDHNVSPQNFGGTFSFGGGDRAPALNANGLPNCAGQPVLTPITSIERYRWTLLMQQSSCSPADIRRLGGGATQFSINAGNPEISSSQFDVGLFVGDDWRVRPNLTLSLGLRYETQNNIHDWRDFSPRLTVAWAPGPTKQNSRSKTVVRAGFGVFYDRFSLSNTLTALRYNGIVQQQYVVANPDFFPTIPSIFSLTGFQTTQTIQQISTTLRAPYIIQSAVSLERQLPFNTTIAITFANAHGLHMLRSEVRPGPVFLMESSGLYNQNQLITYVNSRLNKDVSLSVSYVLNRAKSNTDGLGTFPAKPNDFTGEYGPASTDVRHRFTLTGSINTKWNVRLNPFVVAQSGPPFDITVGRDLYGTTLFNGRPGIPTDLTRPGLIQTTYGLLDPNPTPNERTLSRNFGRGPGSITMNLRVTKTIEFGPEGSGSAGPPPSGPGSGGGGDRRGTPGVFSPGAPQGPSSASRVSRRYNLSIAMSVNNLLNHTNPGPIIGNITSPLFGHANQPSGGGGGFGGGGGLGFSESANNRRLELQLRFSF